MPYRKKARDIECLDPELLKKINELPEEQRLQINQGTHHSNLIEAVPTYIRLGNEKVWNNENNAWIVLGRDRPGDDHSGYGARGDTQAGSIDIVCGRMAPTPCSEAQCDPDFKVDAARIYISQKTDVDANFGIVEGEVGSFRPFERPGSAVAMKADAVRLMARDGGIKLVTGIDPMNSQGGPIGPARYIGIDLIAGNDDSDMQPLVKGDNMAKCIRKLNKDIGDLAGIVDSLASMVVLMNEMLTGHTHMTAWGPSAPDLVTTMTLPMIAGAVSNLCTVNLATFATNRSGFNQNFLQPNAPLGKNYILSEYNHTN